VDLIMRDNEGNKPRRMRDLLVNATVLRSNMA
jgi:hypothetical protein